MEKDDAASPDMEEFPTSVAALLKEVSQTKLKGLSGKDNFKYMRTQLINFLLACGRTTVARARATNPITLSNGGMPRTILALPPGWLKLDDWDLRHLQRCGTADKFVCALRSILAAKRRALENPKRPPGESAQPPTYGAKRARTRVGRWRRVLSESPSDHATKATSSTPGGPNHEGLKENEGPIRGLDAAPRVDKLPAPEHDRDGLQRLRNGEAVAEFASRAPPGAGEVKKDTRRSRAETKRDIHETGQEMKGDATQGEAMADSIGILAQNGGADGQTSSIEENDTAAYLPNRVSGTSMPSDSDSDEETDSDSQDEDIGRDMPLSSDPTTQDSPSVGQPDLKAEQARMMSAKIMDKVANVTTEVMSVDSSSWDEYKPILIEHLHELGLGRAAPSVSTDPKIADNPLRKFKTALTLFGDEVAKIPVRPWVAYKKKLIAFCSSPQISAMDTAQRLEKIRTILYLGEEEHAIRSGEWERAENAVRMCAVLAVATGSEDETQAQPVADQWVRSKHRDIVCVQRILQADSSARSVQTRAEVSGA